MNTLKVMLQVIYALIPVILAAIYFYRLAALLVIANCVVSCLITERIINVMRKQPSTLGDGSAALTGILLALVLPPSVQWYAASLGSVFAIAVAKHLFGGLGHNIFNPALAGRAFLAACYPKMLTTWIQPFSLDAVSSATPLALRKFNSISTSIDSLFVGSVSGCLGETSALLLAIGGIYIIIKKIADWRIPLSMLGVVTITSFLFYLTDNNNGSVLFHLFSGGLMLGVLFMATDPVTTPVTKKGRFIFGAGAGFMVMMIRYFGGMPEGVMYSILFMNALVPLINRYTKPLSLGR
jgi:electron transport complex protein RnfD